MDDDDDDALEDFPDLQIAYRRPTLIPCDDRCHNQDDELSDYVLVRLAIARAKAMDRYREINTEEKGY